MAKREYDIAFSFADKNRDYVLRVAKLLQDNGLKVFNYTDHEVRAKALGQDLTEYLQRIYRDDADFVVLFISKAYTKRPWTKMEVRYAHENAVRGTTSDYILPARFDQSTVPGLVTSTAYENLRSLTPDDFARLLFNKLRPGVPFKDAPVSDQKPPRKWKIRRIAEGAVVAAVVATLFALPVMWWLKRLAPSVAVVAIRNESRLDDAAWVGTAISELLASHLEAGSSLRVIPEDEIARMKRDLQLVEGARLSKRQLGQIRKRLSVRWVIDGSYRYKMPDDLPNSPVRLQLRMLDAATGRQVATVTGTGAIEQLGKLVSPATHDLREQAKLPQLSNLEMVQLEASLPASGKALRLYSQALMQLQSHHAKTAHDLLLEASAVEKHPRIHSALADAHLALERRDLAGVEAQKAANAAGELSEEEQRQLKAHALELASPPGWTNAVKLRTQLWTTRPRKLEHGLRLADTQISQGQGAAALLTIAELRNAAPDDPRVDLMEARARQQTSLFFEQRKSARSAARKAEAIGAISLIGEARLIEATADYDLGDLEAMEAAVKDAHQKYVTSGDEYGEARALEHLATTYDAKGDYENERHYLDLAQEIHRGRGDEYSVARVNLNKGTTFYSEDRMDDALPLYKKALHTFTEFDTPYSRGMVLYQMGAMKFLRGDLNAAQTLYLGALGMFDRAKDRARHAAAVTNVGEVYECLGNLDEALKSHADSLGINTELGQKLGIAYDRFRLGEVLQLKGKRPEARIHYRQALELYKGENFEHSADVADTYVALAELDIADRNVDAARKSLGKAEAIFRDDKVITTRPARRLAVAAKLLLMDGKQEEALALAEKALRKTNAANLRDRLPIEITRERIRAKSGKREDVGAALTSLQQTASVAQDHLFLLYEREAHRAIAEIEKSSARSDTRIQRQ